MADYSITAVTRRVVYTGSAGVGPYAFTFPVISQTDIAVYKNSTKLTLTTNYTVTIDGATGTGSVTLVVAATGSDQIVIIGARAIERTTDFVTAGDLKASSLNEQLDASIILIQQLAEENKRTLKAPQFDAAAVEDGGTVNMVLPASTTRANKVLAFDASGNPSTTITATEVSNAQTYATNAAASATSATASATSATASATSATSSASSATSSASSATSSASAASTSASNASTSASNASTSASNASTSETNAATSASGASTSATNAAASASAASTSASNASSAQTAAESARDATLAAYDNFDDRYLGSKTSDPTLDNDGNALVGGALYFNSVAGEMRIWTGSAWVAAYVSGTGFVAKSGDTMTGVLGLTAGTVSLPALTTTGDTNTGIFFPAADTIAFTEGGAEAMRINSSGNVLIGTTVGSTKISFPIGTNPTIGQTAVTGHLAGNVGSVGIGIDDGGGYGGVYVHNTHNGTYSSTDLRFLTGQGGVSVATERMRIASSGNVGIGTTSPSTKLHVAGELTLGPVSTEGGQVTFHNPDASTGLVIDVSTANNARIFNTTNNFNLQIGQIVGTGGSIDFYTGATSRATINSSGDFSFNSGYGSAAVAYGCRAWVNFNGTGTVAIRASGNVSSITDNGTGDYTVNFTTALVDANYAVTSGQSAGSGANIYPPYFGREVTATSAPTTSSFRAWIKNSSNAAIDIQYLCFAIFR